MIQTPARVLFNTLECAGYFRMGITCDPRYADAKPGQFVMVRFADRLHPLLRRPFSIHRIIRDGDRIDGIEILYKVVGLGTDRLSVCRAGDRLDLFGPLGNHFRIPTDAATAFIVAGGIGVAPMVFLSDHLRANGVSPSDCAVFVGGRSKNDLLCLDALFNIGMNTVHITTDDGSAGDRELVTGPLERQLEAVKPDVVYACGPIPMLKAVTRIAESHAVPCQISIESMMACGMGACLGCAVTPRNPKAPYLHACIHGPVFDASRISL